MDFYIAHSEGGYARLARRLPGRRLVAWYGSHVRMNFMVHRKVTTDSAFSETSQPAA